jgi:D-alanyl-D-alanine carboxypeptidase
MACLGVSLYTIVLARSENVEEKVIFGGYENVYAGTDLVSYADPNAESVTIDDGLIWPDIDITLRQYSMVNADNLLASAFEPDLAIDENGKLVPIYGTKYQYFDAAAKPYLDKMLQDMEKLGFTPYIASSYRTYSYQSQLYNTKAFGIFMEMGYTNSDYDKYGTEEGTEVYNAYQLAAEKAKKYTAAPGASEHQLGLAVDIWDKERDRLGSYSYMNEEFRTWLEEHSWEYGFIQRYPSKKCLRTGWDEPWHYRYVGVEVAKFIKENDICYEEFYKHYSPDFKD